MDVTFNSRMQPATFSIPGKISKTYSYHDDGTLRFSSDAIDHRFDRSYGFDHAGRLKSAFSGADARGEGTTSNRPYYQTYGYDAFGHLNQRTVKTWSTGDFSVSWSFVNNRRLGINWQYDADGRRVHSDGYNSYDAAGRNNYMEVSGSSLPIGEMTFDGDGQQIKTIDSWVDENFERLHETKYYLRSTVLGGQVLAELDEAGAVWRSYVFAGAAILGWLSHSYNDAVMTWEQRDPSDASVRGIGEQELDPLGADAGTFATSVPPTERAIVSYGTSHDPGNPNMTYSVDGIRMPVEDFMEHAGFILKDPLGLMESLTRKSAVPIGYKITGVSYGRGFQLIYDANLNETGRTIFGNTKHEFELPYYGFFRAIFKNEVFDPTLLPQNARLGRLLTGERRKEYVNARDTAQKQLHSSDPCRKFLESLGINPNDVARTINRQVAYDGTTSSISMAGAGLLSPSDTDSRMSVQIYFQTFGVSAATSLAGGRRTRNDVYFGQNGLRAETVIHEALHTLTGLKSDVDLARKLGMTVDEIWQMNTKGTKVISDKLAANGCGGTTP